MSSSSSSTASGSPANTDARITWLRPVQPMFGVVSDKKILKNAIFSALHQHNLGGVVQKEGANSRNFTLICRSLTPYGGKVVKEEATGRDISDITNLFSFPSNSQPEDEAEEDYSPVGACIVPRRDNFGVWRNAYLDENDDKVVRLRALRAVDLSDYLRKNGQPCQIIHKQTMIEACLFGEIHGALPKCNSCMGFLGWSKLNEVFVCRGYFDKKTLQAFSCPITRSDVSFGQWISPEVDVTVGPCEFLMKFSLRKNAWHYDERGSVPHHSVTCFEMSRITTAIAKNCMQENALFTKTGDLNQSVTSLMEKSNLTSASRATVARAVDAIKEKAFEEPRKEGKKQLFAFLAQTCQENPGTVCRVLVEKGGKQQFFQLASFQGGKVAISDSDSFSCPTIDASEIGVGGIIQKQDLIIQLNSLRRDQEILLSSLDLLQKRDERNTASKAQAMIDNADVRHALILEANKRWQADREAIDLEFGQKIQALEHAIAAAECEDEQENDDGVHISFVSSADNGMETDPLEFEGGKVLAICVAFGPSVTIAKHVGKNIFCIDGTHMKDGKHLGIGEKGQLLICEIEDSLDRIYPLAVCYCYHEDTANYVFLVDTIKCAGLELNQPKHVVMSDRSKASFKLQKVRLPAARLRNCSEHIIRNIQKRIKRRLSEFEKAQIRDCFRALHEYEFLQAMKTLSGTNNRAYEYLDKIDHKTWAAFTFLSKGIRTFGRSTNNTAESENSRSLWARRMKSLLEVFVQLFRQYGNTLAERQAEIRNYNRAHIVVHKALEQAQNLRSAAASFKVQCQSLEYPIYEVSDKSTAEGQGVLSVTRVDLVERKCDCGVWQDAGAPCVHALAVKLHLEKTSQPIVFPEFANYWFDPIYRVASYNTAFQVSFLTPNPKLIIPSEHEMTIPRDEIVNKKRGRKSTEKRMTSTGE